MEPAKPLSNSCEPTKSLSTRTQRAQELCSKCEIESSTGNTELHLAVMRNDSKRIRELLQQKANIKIKNKAGDSPLDLAVLFDSDLLLILDDELMRGLCS